MGPPNVWHLFILRENPFFQSRLGSGPSARPLELFVGREAETARLLRTSTGGQDSRQTIEAPPGYGKTTLAEWMKKQAADLGYLSRDQAVGVGSMDDADSLVVGILRYLYEAIVGYAPPMLDHPALAEARLLIQTHQRREVSASASIAGIGFGGGVSTRTERADFQSPRQIVPELLERLSAAARGDLGRRGILLHLNNLENLTDADLQRATRSLRDLRDVFLTAGLHTLLVGPPEAIRPVMSAHPQLRSVFAVPHPLPPLTTDEVHALLAGRYSYLRADSQCEVRAPVEHRAVSALYPIFHGDLRNFLRALELACAERLGYARVPDAALGLQEIHEALAPLYRAEAEANLSETLFGYLEDLAASGAASFAQADLVERWSISQPAVSGILSQLQRAGYIRAVGRQARRITYTLTAGALLAFTRKVSGPW